MDEINEMTRCVEVSFQGMKFAMEASQDALFLLSRMLQIFDNSVKNIGENISTRREKKLAKKLSKETGKTSMELLKMKGQYMFGKMDKETFEAFEKQAEKYGIQYAAAPTLEEGVNRIALRDIDITAFEMFLKDYEAAHCQSQRDITEFRQNNGLDSPVEYMQKSEMGKCSNEQYKQAMEATYGKDWDKEAPQIQSMDTQKKEKFLMRSQKMK